MENIYIAIATGALALIFALSLTHRVLKEDQGTDAMKEIGRAVQEGASAFLRREYTTLAIFVVIVAVVLGVFIDPETAVAYVVGAICSAGTGYIGMSIAVRANTRTASAAMRGLNPGLRVAFNSGAVMGTTVVGISIIGLSILYLNLPGHHGGSRLRLWRILHRPLRPRGRRESSQRPQTLARTLWARLRWAFRRTTHATRPPLPTTLATTWVTWQAWAQTCSSPTHPLS